MDCGERPIHGRSDPADTFAMRIKPMTPLGLAFTFSVLLAGWASAANGLRAPSGHSHSDALASSAQHHGKVVSTLQRPAGPAHQAHGGSVQRFHESASCPLPNGVTLPGNWTHGDYVSAWAGTGDPAAVQAAAHSSCGKPVKGAGHSKSKHGKREHGDRKQGKGAGHSKSKHDHGHGD
jgi:hypothetical protein